MDHFFFFFLLSLISSTILIGEPYLDREIKDTLKQAIMLNSKLDQLFIAKYGELHPFKPYIEKTKRILAAYIQESIKQADHDPTALSQLEMVVSAVSNHTQNIMQSFYEQSNQSNTPQAGSLPQEPMQDYLHAMHNVQETVPQSYQNFISGQKKHDNQDLKNALTVFGVTFGSALFLGAGFLWWRHLNGQQAKTLQGQYRDLIGRTATITGRFRNIEKIFRERRVS